MYHQQHTVTGYLQKQNLATSAKPTFDNANCSDDQAKSFLYKTSFRSPAGVGQARGRGVNWLTWHKAKILWEGFDTKTRDNG